ncbi:hypothetical protein L3Q82_000302 [Scortum barcoo]|uniref:Uncharacterized protein n=1 Tax=Scortum barcoo TaxID=214431 RepID=A0ACB8XAF0_9TELE|nr:hypothetical protein L3Q82_000302 [Scortum barcoo]
MPVKPRSWWWISDFRRCSHSPPEPVNILGMDIDVVKSYKYLGVHLNDSLDWSDNTNALVKKGNSRLFLLRRLRSFGVQGPLLRTFYDSVVASAIFYGIVCWASSISDRDRRRMDRLVRRMPPGLSGADLGLRALLGRLQLLRTPDWRSAARRTEGKRKRCAWKQKRGKRGGLLARLKANAGRPPIPSLFLSNVRSLDNKLDLLRLRLGVSSEMRNCSVLCLT